MQSKAIIFIIISLLLLSACGNSSTPRDESAIIREMVQTYAKKPQEAQTKVPQLVDELAAINPESGELWQNIMTRWDEVNHMEINYDALPDDIENPEKLCIVVLGFQLNPDGSMQGELIGRLETALNCAKQYPEAYVLCTGGGTASKNSKASEAGEMAKWLRKKGVAKSRIIVEDNSLSTVQNAQFSYEILRRDYPEVDRIAIVTSDYHIPWGSILFEVEFLMEGSEITLAHHAAFAADDPGYSILGYQASGIMELAGVR